MKRSFNPTVDHSASNHAIAKFLANTRMLGRVMQRTETGEEFNVFEATIERCENWIEDNADQFPESTFNVEAI